MHKQKRYKRREKEKGREREGEREKKKYAFYEAEKNGMQNINNVTIAITTSGCLAVLPYNMQLGWSGK